jgi:arginyl-tRNA synthetase
MAERNFSKKELKIISEKIGVSSVIFNDISVDRNKDPEFDWNKILDFNGETAPYVQYTAVRIKSILKKYADEFADKDINCEIVQNEFFEPVLKVIGNFDSAVETSLQKLQPYVLAVYLVELAREFNIFYNKVRILSENSNERYSNICFIKLILSVIEKGSKLIGIHIPEKM